MAHNPPVSRARTWLTKIVRDERDNLPNYMSSVAGLFDEVVGSGHRLEGPHARDRPCLAPGPLAKATLRSSCPGYLSGTPVAAVVFFSRSKR